MRKSHVPVILTLLAAMGCQWRGAGRLDEYETLGADPRRNTQAARRHNAEAVKLLRGGRLEQAERKLKAALAADLFFGAAHNNLGTVYHRQKKFYLAAWQFQYAAKLIPNRAEPRNNLGMVFEAVGRLDEAVGWYEKALQMEPDNTEVIGNLARAYVRSNRKDQKTRKLLSEIILKDQRPDWIDWARRQLALMGRPQPSDAATQPATKE